MHQLSAQLTLLHEEKSGLCAPYISPAGRVNCVLKNGPCFTIATSTTVCSHCFEIPPGSKTSNFPTPFVCNSIRVFLKVYSSSSRYVVFLRTVLWNFPVPIFLNGLGDCVLGLRNSRKTPFTVQVFLLVWNQKVSSLKCWERKDRYSKQRWALQARCYLVPKHTLTTQQITQYLLFNLPVGQKTHNLPISQFPLFQFWASSLSPVRLKSSEVLSHGPNLLSSSLLFQMVTRTKKIFVGGLSASTVVEDVKQYFEQFGKVRPEHQSRTKFQYEHLQISMPRQTQTHSWLLRMCSLQCRAGNEGTGVWRRCGWFRKLLLVFSVMLKLTDCRMKYFYQNIYCQVTDID